MSESSNNCFTHWKLRHRYVSFFETEGCTLNEVLLTVTQSQLRVIVPYKIKECYLLRSCLIAGRRMLLFMAEQVFLLMGEVCMMHNAVHSAQ